MFERLQKKFLPALPLLLISHVAAGIDTDRSNVQAFIDRMVEEHSYDRDKLVSVLGEAESKESILEAISRPAERTLEWHEYRKIFLQEPRISQGVTFWSENEDVLVEAERRYRDTGVFEYISTGGYYHSLPGDTYSKAPVSR